MVRIVKATYIVFSNNEMLAMTQALGHNEITGCKPLVHKIIPENFYNIRIFVGSDGFFDMIIKDSIEDLEKLSYLNIEQLQVFINSRYTQAWNIEGYDESTTIDKSEIDDISLICCDII